MAFLNVFLGTSFVSLEVFSFLKLGLLKWVNEKSFEISSGILKRWQKFYILCVGKPSVHTYKRY
jgi:hypothetical protein